MNSSALTMIGTRPSTTKKVLHLSNRVQRRISLSPCDSCLFMGFTSSLLYIITQQEVNVNTITCASEYTQMLGSINAISIVILAIYVVLIVKQPKESEEHHDDIDSKLTVKQIVVLFVVFSLLLIVASVLITYTTDLITKEIPWLGGTVAGAILLGVATSLPFDKKNSVTNVTELSNHCSGDSFFFKRCTNYCNNLTC